MTGNELDSRINGICLEIKQLIAIEYGDASQDELIKLNSFNKMNLTFRDKLDFLNYTMHIKKYLTIREYIDYILTLVQLLSIDNKIIKKPKHLDLILNIFNRMLVSEYESNLETFTNTKLLNHIAKTNNINSVVEYLVNNYKNSGDIETMLECIDGFGCKNENRRF